MKAIQIYAITTGSVFAILIIINALLSIMQKLHVCNMIILKHFIYSFLIRRYRLIDSWTKVDVLWRVVYFTINVFFSVFSLLSMAETVKRTGYIFLINMIFLFLESHLSFLTDILDLRLHTYQILHSVSVAIIFTLGIVHVILGLLYKSTYRHFIERSQVAGFIVWENSWIKNETDYV